MNAIKTIGEHILPSHMMKMRSLHMGIYSNMDLALCMEIDTGTIVLVDYDCKNVEKIADSLEAFLDQMTPVK
ncbi:MAG: SecY-interacting protein Syd [Lachnospiraceae bacterium]|nr:SecY-interacting protein Syd [Lachnospiraceae bacterium]